MRNKLAEIRGALWRTPIADHLFRDGMTLTIGALLLSMLFFTPIGMAFIKALLLLGFLVAALYGIADKYVKREVNRQRTVLADFLYFALTDSRYTIHSLVQGVTDPEAIFDRQVILKDLPPIGIQSEVLKTSPNTMSAEGKTLLLQTFLAASYTFWRERGGESQNSPIVVSDITETRTTILIEMEFASTKPAPVSAAQSAKQVPKTDKRHDKIRTFPRADLLEAGLIDEVPADLALTPHICIVGQTGSGKTTACKTLLDNILTDIPDSTLWVLDYKGEDFQFLQKCNHYFENELCIDGLETFYKSVFLPRKNRESSARNRVVLVIEEYSSLLASLDKAQGQRVRTIIGNLLRLSRAFSISLILTSQRADAQLFDAGARENFGIVAGFSALSDESKRMLFSDYIDEMLPISGTGRGYISVTGVGLAEIEILRPKNPVAVEALMRARCN